MKIKMTKTTDGSPDGININTYEKGEKYDVPDSLAENFVGQDAAKKEDKGKEKAPENKEEAPENKGGGKDKDKGKE